MSLSGALRRSSKIFLSGSSSRSFPLPFGGIRRRTTSGCAAGERRRMRLSGRGVGCSGLRFGGFFTRFLGRCLSAGVCTGLVSSESESESDSEESSDKLPSLSSFSMSSSGPSSLPWRSEFAVDTMEPSRWPTSGSKGKSDGGHIGQFHVPGGASSNGGCKQSICHPDLFSGLFLIYGWGRYTPRSQKSQNRILSYITMNTSDL
jgi:hypothetical protein